MNRLRSLVSALLAVGVTFGLFLFMFKLISSGGNNNEMSPSADGLGSISGYASSSSVRQGSSINFHISAASTVNKYDLVVFRTDRRCRSDDSRCAADTGTHREQGAELAAQTQPPAKKGDDQQCCCDGADDDGQRLGANGTRFPDRQPDAEQNDTESQDAHEAELDTRLEEFRQLDRVSDQDAENDGHHDGTDRALGQAHEIDANEVRKVLPPECEHEGEDESG